MPPTILSATQFRNISGVNVAADSDVTFRVNVTLV